MAEAEDCAEDPKIPMRRKSAKIYVIKVTLQCLRRKIWRIVHVPSDATFQDLHYTIQKIMNWENYHLHRFQGVDHLEGVFIENVKYSLGADETGEVCLDETKVKLCDYFKTVGDSFCYNYDYGKDWNHDVELQAIKSGDPDVLYPICVDGKNAGPPEDCNEAPEDWPFDHREFDPKTAMDRIVYDIL